MMGAEREEWTRYFAKADEMDGSRSSKKDKTDYWRTLEKEALNKLQRDSRKTVSIQCLARIMHYLAH